MPVGMDAAPELMPTVEQRKYIYHRLREIRSDKSDKQIFVMDFQNDEMCIRDRCGRMPAG